jgi:hypothetical protein
MSDGSGSWVALTLGWLDMKNPRGFGYACERVLPEVASESKWTTWRDAVGIERLDVGVLYQPVANDDDMKLKRRKSTLVVDLTRSGTHLTEGSAEHLLALARREVGAVLEQICARVQPRSG